MKSEFHIVAPPSACGYLPEQRWQLEHEFVSQMTAAEYAERLLHGWRRFGRMLFRPRCPRCTACRSIRVDVRAYLPNRSQRRAARLNEDAVNLTIRTPSVTQAKLSLYDRYHAHQSLAKGWPEHPARDATAYAQSFVDNPFPIEEWCYSLDSRLIGVGYVDVLPTGLSAIYFFYDPAQSRRSLGTWNVYRIVQSAAHRGLPHVYLGYYVEGCASMSYKASFIPNQLLDQDGIWRDFRK